MDYLTKQAPEILAMIFKEVHALNGQQQMLGAISKQLLPYTRQNLYHDVLDSYDQVERFISTVDSRLKGNKNGELLGSLVESLYVKIWPEESREGQLSRPIGLFINLENVKKVTIERSMHLSRSVLLPKVAEKCLPKLESLAFLELGGFPVSPLDLRCWSSLPLYNSLHTLEINLSYGSSFDEDDGGLSLARHGSDKEVATKLSQITSLKLGGDLLPLSQEVKNFINVLNNLKDFSIEGRWGDSIRPTIFADNTPTLKHLSIARDNSINPYGGELGGVQILSDLERVPNVVSLDLGYNVYGASTIEFARHLKKLETLTLEASNFELFLDTFEPFVIPGIRPPQMRTLTLNFSDGEQGKDLRFCDAFQAFSLEDSKSLIAKASEFDIELNGTFIEAVREYWDDDQRSQVVEEEKMVVQGEVEETSDRKE